MNTTILEYMVLMGNWRLKTNIELDELMKHRNIINYVKAQN